MNSFVPFLKEQKEEALGPNPPPEYLHWEDFEDVPLPEASDWLASHENKGQSFQEFQQCIHKNVPDSTRTTIYIQPFGAFATGRSPSLRLIKQYVEAFYGLPTQMRDPIDPSLSGVRFNIRYKEGKIQYLTGDILRYIKETLPQDAFCMIAFSMEDLYPRDSWNYVFGIASLSERAGVCSFARFNPTFYDPRLAQQDNYQQIILKRSLKVVIHEIGHMFGLKHCVYFNCLMRGSNEIGEADMKPLYFCPICLRKLQFCVGFDVMTHYKKLMAFWQDNGFKEEAVWFEKRLKTLSGSSNNP